jgi:Ni,Fe-hydrogenase III component G
VNTTTTYSEREIREALGLPFGHSPAARVLTDEQREEGLRRLRQIETDVPTTGSERR